MPNEAGAAPVGPPPVIVRERGVATTCSQPSGADTTMRDPLQQFDYEPGIAVASPEQMAAINRELIEAVSKLPPLIAKLALKTDDPADTARILIDRHVENVRFFVERLLRQFP